MSSGLTLQPKCHYDERKHFSQNWSARGHLFSAIVGHSHAFEVPSWLSTSGFSDWYGTWDLICYLLIRRLDDEIQTKLELRGFGHSDVLCHITLWPFLRRT